MSSVTSPAMVKFAIKDFDDKFCGLGLENAVLVHIPIGLDIYYLDI